MSRAAGLVLLAAVACESGGDSHQTEEPVARAGPITIDQAYAPAPVLPETGAAYFTVHNAGPRPDTILGIVADVADSASLHTQVAAGGSMRMVHLESVDVPAGGRAALAPGGRHVMLMGLRRLYTEGDSIRIEIDLAVAGAVSFWVPVLSYADVADMAEPQPAR